MQNFYDSISKKWDATRRSAWGEFEFAHELLSAQKILDAGCGNGRLNFWLAGNNFHGEYCGFDSSKNLIALARKNFPAREFVVADLRELTPEISRGLTDGKPDAIFCVAVLHHLTNSAEQKKALENLYASLQPDGRIFLTVWNLWQPRFWKFRLAQKFARTLTIPFAGAGVRTVFAFRKGELKKLCATTGFKNIKIFYARHAEKSNFFRGRNLIILAEK